MYKHIITSIVLGITLQVGAQMQITNSGFELWNNVGQDTEEPQNWNSNKTGTGYAPSGPQTVFRESSIVHSGNYSARIKTGTYLSIFIVNGVMTNGRVNAPTTTASQGYNQTLQADTAFNAPLSAMPDSIVFWARYAPGTSDQARIEAVIHTAYDQRVPMANDPSTTTNAVAQAQLDFGTTSGDWQRKAVGFNYNGFSATTPAYVLVNFTSSNVPGAGSASSTLYIDDIELIYNPTSTKVDEQNEPTLNAFYQDGNLYIRSTNTWSERTSVMVTDMAGKEVFNQTLQGGISSATFGLPVTDGLYIITLVDGNKVCSQRFFVTR
jgi:hypothetical protein